MMTADRVTCIVFSTDDLPLKGSNHTRPLYITIDCSSHKVPSVLLENGTALNICPLTIVVALNFAPSGFGPAVQTVRTYDSTQREVIGNFFHYRFVDWPDHILYIIPSFEDSYFF